MQLTTYIKLTGRHYYFKCNQMVRCLWRREYGQWRYEELSPLAGVEVCNDYSL